MARSKLLELLHGYFPLGVPISRKSWEWLDLFSLFEAADVKAADSDTYVIRRLVDRFNAKRLLSPHAAETLYGGQLLAMAVIVDVLRYVVLRYAQQQVPDALSKALDSSAKEHGPAFAEKPLAAFVELFPPASMLRQGQGIDTSSLGRSEMSANVASAPAEMILLSLAVSNKAFQAARQLFDDEDLRRQAPYSLLVEDMSKFFDGQEAFAPLAAPLFRCLHAPAFASPESLMGQLNYIREHWSKFLPPELNEMILLALDVLREEELLRGIGPGPNVVLEFLRKAYEDFGYSEPDRFSPDADWMSNVVLIAKSIYVWLYQLSRKYGREIRRLNEIPDEELDHLARWGFTGLWLIGVWERSPASQKIKQMMGNPEAAASAYSLYDYTIAGDLGGEAAYRELRDRAWQRGIHLSSDMVPNHMGVYSKWVIEHPDWFLQLDYPPFPSYRFNGADLSMDERVMIQIEDGYWDRRDAAVVFKRTDKWTGSVRYIYHGNDGTSMPWNDTAQLNFLLPEVREAVIQTILHVARLFSIIRFDAAMTLAKRHYQRLWFPQPGEGGAIPSRAEHSMARAQFDATFPIEFWREVVDRVAREVPDTLLLAEAFWLMEGYFVRTLGMHRVYNSAFMNMLKMEDNLKYRLTVKNVLEFSPEVLKRFVNFMNNPDEETAVAQFGKGDKYFGIAVLMVTMPGLPMFGHGQIEGFAEKYGMEYRRSYWDEQVDEDMVHRHETEIFPLMRRRRLFSGSANFAFYDFNTADGWVDENVFAYSNRAGDERALILYNNAYNTTRGGIHTSTAINIGTHEAKNLVRKSLTEALALKTEPGYFYSFRDHRTKLQYVRSGRQIADEGILAVLAGYQYHAFLDFRELYDVDGSWAGLSARLAGAGVPSLYEAYQEMKLEPILVPFRALVNAENLGKIITGGPGATSRLEPALRGFLQAAKNYVSADVNIDDIIVKVRKELKALHPEKIVTDRVTSRSMATDVLSRIGGEKGDSLRPVIAVWVILHHLDQLRAPGEARFSRQEILKTRHESWLLRKALAKVLSELSKSEAFGYSDALLATIISLYEDLLTSTHRRGLASAFETILKDPLVGEYVHLNKYRDALWFNKEQIERLVQALVFASEVKMFAEVNLSDAGVKQVLQAADSIVTAAGMASYQVEKTIELLTT